MTQKKAQADWLLWLLLGMVAAIVGSVYLYVAVAFYREFAP